MTDQERAHSMESGDGTADRADEAQANGAEAPSEARPSAEGAEPTIEDKLAAAQAEAARTRDQLLRTAADFDNFRKRSRREAEDAQRRGRESILKELLPVFDNLERAATHADAAPDAKSVAEGLRMVLKQFSDTVGKLGVKRVPTTGAPFDPAVHEAIQHLESKEPPGTVIAEVQPGYTMGDQLLRPAMVVVSKGPGEAPGAGEPS